MNLDKLGQFAATVVIAAAVAGHLDLLNHWVQIATAKLVWESRTSTWGSPRFFPENYHANFSMENHSKNQKSKSTTDRKIHVLNPGQTNKGEVL